MQKMQEMWVQSLGQEDPLEKGVAIYPLQYSFLENPMGRGASQAIVLGVAKGQMKLSNWVTCTHRWVEAPSGRTFLPNQGFFFWLCHRACGILVPWPGIETMPSSVEAQNHNHWTAREVLKSGILTLPCASRILGMSMNFFLPESCSWTCIGLAGLILVFFHKPFYFIHFLLIYSIILISGIQPGDSAFSKIQAYFAKIQWFFFTKYICTPL